MNQPTIDMIINKLEQIIEKKISREDVADWAIEYLEEDEIEIIDMEAWEFLKCVGAIDIVQTPEKYLYETIDIESWISEYSKKNRGIK